MQFFAKLGAAAALCLAATLPAAGGTIKTFNVSGSFEATSAIVPALAGGSFSGTYSIDVDQMPLVDSQILLLAGWDVTVRNSSGGTFATFVNGAPDQSASVFGNVDGTLRDEMSFVNFTTGNTLRLLFFSGFDRGGGITASGTNTNDFITRYSQFDNGGALTNIRVVSGSAGLSTGGGGSTATPEPATFVMFGAAGILVAIGKRRKA